LLIVCGGALLLMFCLAFLLMHGDALLLVFSGALLVIVLCADTLMGYTALLHIHSVAHLFHLGLAVFIFHSATLLLVRCTALFLIGCHRLELCVAILLSLLRHVPSIHGQRK